MIHLTFNDTPLKYNNDWIGNHNPVVDTSAFFISGTYGARDGASAMGEAKTPLITYVSGIPSADVAVNTTVINGHVSDVFNTSSEPPEVKWTFSNFTNGKTFKPNIYVKDAMYSAKISLYSFYTARTEFKLYTAADSAYPEITNGGSAMNSPSGSIVTLQPTNNALGYYGGLNFKYYLDNVQFPSATDNFNSPFGILLECTAQPTNGSFRIIESGNWILSGHLAEPPQPPVPTYTDLGPFNTWTIPPRCTDCLTYSGDDTVRLYGKGGYEEVIDRSFTVEESGTYKISYDYNIPMIKYYSNYESDVMHFGIYISTAQPPQQGGDLYRYARYSRGNCNGADIVGNSAQTQYPGSGHIEFEYTLSANTTYWLWLPFGNCEDNMEMFFTFTNLRLTKV